MHLVYIDDERDPLSCVFSTLVIPATEWHLCFRQVRDFRRQLKLTDGIYLHEELHAWKFVSGRGRPSPSIITNYRRSRIFDETLRLITQLPGARLSNAVFPRKADEDAFEQLLNRIDRTMIAWDSHAILISDQGKEQAYTRLVRKVYVFNPIPSQYGTWRDSGRNWRNMPLDRIVEDPFFKDSAQSYLVQLVDFCAYALLRRENPILSKTKYGIDKSFDILQPILVKEATRKNAEGIIGP